MPNVSTHPCYQLLLDALQNHGMVLVRLASKQAYLDEPAPKLMTYDVATRTFLLLSRMVRRSIVASQYLETLPMPAEERSGRVLQSLDRVLEVVARHKMTVEQYNRAINIELDGGVDEEAAELDLDEDDFADEFDEEDEDEIEFDPDANILGRPAAALVAELYRDFGMVAHTLPSAWLELVPAELRLLSARAAAAAIGPSVPAVL